MVGVALIILLSLARWGGTVTPGPLFLLGIAVLSSLIVAFGVLTAWLYHAPPPSVATPSRSANVRHTLAVLILASTTFFTLGGFWDEVWHRRYGGFGDDFLWPPHLLIYMSLLMMALFAGGGLWLTFRNQGGIRERFRAEAHIGLIGLVCTFLVASLPSDELWHRIYGKDITAWSLPHIIIAAGTITAAFIASHLARREFPSTNGWHTLRGLKSHELIALWLIAIGTVMWLQVGVAEWDAITSLPIGIKLRPAENSE